MTDLYYTFNTFLRKKFDNRKVRKIPINAGFTCPNKDGVISSEGCIFCDHYGSGPIKTFTLPIEDQIKQFIQGHQGIKYLAYYQAHCNTHASIETLKRKYEIIFKFEDIVGLSIGTRPDSIADEVYPLLEALNRRTYLMVELGLQSTHKKSLDFLNRNHTYDQFLDCFQKLKSRGIDVVVHLIVGIPGETKNDMLATVKEMNRLRPAGVKLHLFHVLKDTPLLDMYRQKKFTLLEKEEYIDAVVSMLESLAPEIVIHRLTGERDREIFAAPQWALDKMDTIESIRKRMMDLGTYQGRKKI
jgi:radical SAM protein (TIGR01212 family)